MPIETPTIRQLEYFVAIADAKSFRKAAERLGVSQPTLSSQIYILEECLQTSLLERSRSGTTITPAGRELIVNARKVLEEARGLVDNANMMKNGPGGTFRIGVSPTVGPYLLPHILSDLHKEYSTLKLYVRENKPNTLEIDLLEGRLDIVLIPLPFNNPTLTTDILFHEPFRLLMPTDHQLAKLKHVKTNHLKHQNILTLEEEYSHYHMIQQVCEELGANILRDYEGTSLDALRQMVTMSMGMAFLPSLYIHSEIHQPEAIRITNVEGLKLSRTHVLAWRTSAPNRHFYRQLTHSIRNLVKKNLHDVPLTFPKDK